MMIGSTTIAPTKMITSDSGAAAACQIVSRSDTT